jgi:ubiquinone/menaquinone biosynthesis C-methylase UbiE
MEQYLTVLPSTYDELCLDFEWYAQVRLELLKPMLNGRPGVLDVGTGNGEVLLQIAGYVETGVGIDTDSEPLQTAIDRTIKLGIHNLRFQCGEATNLPSADGSFDLVLILGDVLSYSNLFGRTEQVLSDVRRVLHPKGTVVIDGMNWSWEYAQSPEWTFFLQERSGCYTFCVTRRTAEGLETTEKRAVGTSTPLYRWLCAQKWPVSRQGYRTSLGVRLHAPLPEAWLGTVDSEHCCYYTARSMTELLRANHFGDAAVVCYGLTYEVVSRAGLTQDVRKHVPLLARAEAELARETGSGAGPWLFAHARKPG